MAYNTKAIKTDVNAKPTPQYYNPVTDEYEVLQGTDGAARQVLYGPDGNPISTTEGKLAVRAAELETKIEAVRVLLNTLAGEDFATQTTLAQILAKMIAAPATEAKQDVIAGHVDGVETLLTALTGKDFATQTTLAQILAKMIASPATEAKQDMIAGHVDDVETLLTALKGKDFATEAKLEAVRVLLNSLAGEDFATSAKQAEMLAALGKQSTAEKQDTLVALVGAIDAAAVSDPAAAGAVIALLKGVLSRLQAVEGKIDGITTEDGNVKSQLTGSLVQVVQLNKDDTLVVGAGNTKTITIYAPQGRISRLKSIRIKVSGVPEATTGAHNIIINHGSLATLWATNDYDKDIILAYNYWYTKKACYPSQEVSQIAVLQNIVFSDTVPLSIAYINSTDRDQTLKREILLVCEETAVIPE